MTLEKHIVDTMKEWQMKIGSLDSNMRLYYPKDSLCGYLDLENEIENDVLREYINNYLFHHASYLGEVTVSYEKDRFCFLVGKQGCDYVEQNIPEPEFLGKFLKVLKTQNMKEIIGLFQEYAKQHGTKVGSRKEDNGLDTVLCFEDESIEPYVYCMEENEFGVTYHRFAKSDVPDWQ